MQTTEAIDKLIQDLELNTEDLQATIFAPNTPKGHVQRERAFKRLAAADEGALRLRAHACKEQPELDALVSRLVSII